MLKMLATVKIEVSGAMNGKSGVAGMTHSASQAGLKGQRELSAVRGSEPDVPAQSTQELLQHSSDIADVVANCKRLREDEGFQNALDLAYLTGMEAARGKFGRLQDVAMYRAVLHEVQKEDDANDDRSHGAVNTPRTGRLTGSTPPTTQAPANSGRGRASG